MGYLDSLDIANRACDHCGVDSILSVTEDTKQNNRIAAVYDKVRRAELRRNVWRFAVREAVLRPVATTTRLVVPAAYDATKTYLVGELVSDTNNQYWISTATANLNNPPGGNNEAWEMYFGPRTVTLYDSTLSYFSGELVYVIGASAGSYQVYMSLITGNTDVPGTANAWSATKQYAIDDTVSYLGFQWRSTMPVNLNVTPAVGPLAFDLTATYTTGQTVTASDNFVYSSVGNGNVGNNPVSDAGVHWTNTGVANGWTRTPTITASASSWRPVRVTLSNVTILYPIGSGPVAQTTTQNIYRLPVGFLREAPQDPRVGAVSYLGAPSTPSENDWRYEGHYIMSDASSPIRLRFVADITKVSAFDDMFAEGLAARIASGVCEPLTQASTKLQVINAAYNKFMGEARIINSIEMGPVEPPEDDFIACRV